MFLELGSINSQPFNDTWIRRWSTLFMIKLLKRFRPYHGTVLMLTPTICMKYGSLRHLSEAAAMRFVAEKTSIPVPKVHCAFVRKGKTYIVMERLRGNMLCEGWLQRSSESRAIILQQLKEMVKEMRDLQPPSGTSVASVDGTSLHDYRLPDTLGHIGPFGSVRDFHRYLRRGIEDHEDHSPDIRELIAQHNSTENSTCFTHGDLSSFNILVQGEKVIGIIDWESAGWYPMYWEYVMAWNVNPQNRFWQGEVDRFLHPFRQELAMDMMRQRLFGEL
jgi:tRNA A-37 threonylcarbamoyl transferase component Bud32